MTVIGALSDGTGKTLDQAEEALQSNKSARLPQRKRGPRGVKPPGICRSPSPKRSMLRLGDKIMAAKGEEIAEK